MPNFIYTAKSTTGQAKTGIKEAASQAELAHALKEEGLFLTSVQSIRQSGRQFSPTDFLSSVFSVSLTEKMMFARHLAVMIGAGLSLNKALDILVLQTKNPKMVKIIREISEDVKKGQSFSDALAKHPKVFSGLFVSMVKVGETGGNLEETLKLLAEQMKNDHQLISRVRGAMIYPAVIMVAMFGIGIAMFILVVPKLSAIFKEMKMELPYSTQLIIFLSDFLIKHWLIAASLIILIPVIMPTIIKSKSGQKIFDWLLLKTPLFGGISRKINSARFARTFSSLIEGGIPIAKGLQIVSDTLTNYYFRQSLSLAAEEIQKGKNLSGILKNYSALYPPLVEQMIEVGEETGTLSDILKKLAEFFEEEVNNITKGITSVIEPILMVIIGAAVGFFAISMLQPMYSMMEGM